MDSVFKGAEPPERPTGIRRRWTPATEGTPAVSVAPGLSRPGLPAGSWMRRAVPLAENAPNWSRCKGDAVTEVQPVKDVQKLMWSLGDYREVARQAEPVAVELVEA